MTLESDLFQYLRPRKDALERYGFVRKDQVFVLEKELMPGEFRACLTVDADGHVSGQVTDLFSGDAFVPLRIPGAAGPYVSRVKECYVQWLEEIAKACFEPVPFASDQANRLAARIRETYGDEPDHPFDNDDVSAVFRNPADRKWYALIMHIPYARFCAKEGETDILNVKAHPEDIPVLTEKEGIFPGWHMNRKHWITVPLDDTLPDEDIQRLVAVSRSFTKDAASGPQDVRTWLLPSNPKLWDIIGAMERSDDLIWKQHRNVQKGDRIALYVGAPYSAVLFLYDVTETDVPASYDFGPNYPYEMHLHCIRRFGRDEVPLSLLKQYGVVSVRGPRHAPKALADHLEARLTKNGEHGSIDA